MKKLKSELKWWKQRAKNVYHLGVSAYYVNKYGNPARNLTVIGVTGTDGKTTTCTLIYEILKAAGNGIKPALLSTVSAKIGDEEIETGLHTTNPDARQLQPLIARMVKEGVTHLVLEVTAHGLDQFRVLGCNIQIGVLTNITHEHLDDFIDMERYRRTKLKMFRGVKFAVLNQDDPSFPNFQSFLQSRTQSQTQIIKYEKTKLKEIGPALAGDYNKYNIAAAETVAKILKIPDPIVQKTVNEFQGVPGRRDEVTLGQKFRVIVDFAHTPNALESVLVQLKKELPEDGRLIVIFGATGGRDKEKRPMMGEAAARIADTLIITSDDTRGENQDDIAKQILSGIKFKNSNEKVKITIQNSKVFLENDRRKAIELAVKSASPGDIILLAGKGHEKSILMGKVETPWSDKRIAEELILNALG